MKLRPGILTKSPAWTKLPVQQRGESIYLSGADGRVRSYDIHDGELRWESQGREEADQFLVDDRVVVTSSRDGVSGIRALDGVVLWSRPEAYGLETVSAQAVITSRREDVKALDKNDGSTIWETTSHAPVTVWGDRVITVGGERDRKETLQARDPDTGRIAWSTDDGDIQHVVPNGKSLLYSSKKFGRHHQEVQRISCRDELGGVTWEFRCAGELRGAPVPSPDGSRVALSQKNPIDASTSILTVLDARTGAILFDAHTAMKAEIAFSDDGSLFLSETEYARNPGEEKSWLRCLDENGHSRWSQLGKADWMAVGDQLVVASGTKLSRLSVESGQEVWSQVFAGTLAPVSQNDGQLTISEGGCRLVTVDTKQGKINRTMSNGERVFVGEQGRLSDHQGQVWTERVEVPDPSPFVGRWEQPEPFHIAMKAAPTERNAHRAVFVDWDGDEADDGTDPILLDSQRKIVSMKDLKDRDRDGDQRLETKSLSDLSLWFDSDGDGKVSSEAEVTPLMSTAFDKSRIELDKSLLWLASDSRCSPP